MKLAILTTALIVAATPAAFADRYLVMPDSTDVYVGDLDRNDPGDREEAAYRINIATATACGGYPDIRELQVYNHWRVCRAIAFDDAYAQFEGREPRRGRVETREYLGDDSADDDEDDED